MREHSVERVRSANIKDAQVSSAKMLRPPPSIDSILHEVSNEENFSSSSGPGVSSGFGRYCMWYCARALQTLELTADVDVYARARTHTHTHMHACMHACM